MTKVDMNTDYTGVSVVFFVALVHLENEPCHLMVSQPNSALLQNDLRPFSAADRGVFLCSGLKLGSGALKPLWSRYNDFSTAGQKLYTCSLRQGCKYWPQHSHSRAPGCMRPLNSLRLLWNLTSLVGQVRKAAADCFLFWGQGLLWK